MSKKNKLSVLSDADEDQLSKLAKKRRSEAVSGKPDDSDVRNLTILFETYDRATGGALKRLCEEIKMERALNDKTNERSVDVAESLAFQLPQDLQEEMEKYFPTIWTNPDHLRWFLKKFPMFRR